jgi:predicted anti-sigma-YlaC factor YlaD
MGVLKAFGSARSATPQETWLRSEGCCPILRGVSGEKVLVAFTMALGLGLLSGCSINTLAIRAVGDMLSSGGESTVFTGDDDPELMGDALPFALKLYEILLEGDPSNPALALATGRAFISYASAFVEGPAGELAPDQFDLQTAMHARAKKLFLRGREYVFSGLEIRRPGFRAAVKAKDPAPALAMLKRDDIDYVFWAAAGWLGAFGAEPFDFSLMVTLPRATAMLAQVEAWDEAYGQGALQEILISFYGSAPADIGGSEKKARVSFQKAIDQSKGRHAGPYVSLASTVSVKNQDYKEFKELLSAALAIDPDMDLSSRLQNILSQRRAKWLLDHASDFFLETGEEGQ